MESKRKDKLIGFIAVLLLYLLITGSDMAQRTVWRLMLIYILGATIAFWAGNDPIGTLRPIPLRPLYILIGVVMMAYGCIMTLFMKEALHK